MHIVLERGCEATSAFLPLIPSGQRYTRDGQDKLNVATELDNFHDLTLVKTAVLHEPMKPSPLRKRVIAMGKRRKIKDQNMPPTKRTLRSPQEKQKLSCTVRQGEATSGEKEKNDGDSIQEAVLRAKARSQRYRRLVTTTSADKQDKHDVLSRLHTLCQTAFATLRERQEAEIVPLNQEFLATFRELWTVANGGGDELGVYILGRKNQVALRSLADVPSRTFYCGKNGYFAASQTFRSLGMKKAPGPAGQTVGFYWVQKYSDIDWRGCVVWNQLCNFIPCLQNITRKDDLYVALKFYGPGSHSTNLPPRRVLFAHRKRVVPSLPGFGPIQSRHEELEKSNYAEELREPLPSECFLPATFLLRRRQDIPAILAGLEEQEPGTMWVVKPARGNRGNGVVVLDTDRVKTFLESYGNCMQIAVRLPPTRVVASAVKASECFGGEKSQDNDDAPTPHKTSPPEPILSMPAKALLSGTSPYVIQRYIANPLLLRERKFDIRMYCLVVSAQPLVAFTFDSFYIKSAYDPYDYNPQSINNPFVHLTNVAVQRHNPQLAGLEEGEIVEKLVSPGESLNEAQSSLRKEKTGWLYSRASGDSISKGYLSLVMDGMREVMRACLRSAVAKEKWSGRGENVGQFPLTFQLLGADFLLDDAGGLWLIEVNHNPDLQSHGCDVLENIVKDVVKETIYLTLEVKARMATGRTLTELHEQKRMKMLIDDYTPLRESVEALRDEHRSAAEGKKKSSRQCSIKQFSLKRASLSGETGEVSALMLDRAKSSDISLTLNGEGDRATDAELA